MARNKQTNDEAPKPCIPPADTPAWVPMSAGMFKAHLLRCAALGVPAFGEVEAEQDGRDDHVQRSQ